MAMDAPLSAFAAASPVSNTPPEILALLPPSEQIPFIQYYIQAAPIAAIKCLFQDMRVQWEDITVMAYHFNQAHCIIQRICVPPGAHPATDTQLKEAKPFVVNDLYTALIEPLRTYTSSKPSAFHVKYNGHTEFVVLDKIEHISLVG